MKLTKNLKHDIVEIVINKTFEKRRIALVKQEAALFREAIKQLIPSEFKPTQKTENWYPTTSQVTFQVESSTRSMINLHGDATPIPNYLNDTYYNRVLTKFSVLSFNLQGKITRFEKAYDRFENDKDALKDKLRTLLETVNTSKQLKKSWPDIEKYYHFPDPAKNLPAKIIDITDLNASIKKMSNAA